MPGVQGRALQRSSLTELATTALIDLIQDRGLNPGDALPPTNELAGMFGVSIPVVREAISGLAAVGVVHRQQGKEAVVSTPGSVHLGLLLRFRAQQTGGSDERVQELREIVEVGSARLAAQNATDAAMEEMRDALSRLRSVTNERALHAADVNFHASVARASGNDLLVLFLDSFEPLLHQQREHVWRNWVKKGGDLETIVEAHAKIFERIEAHDPEGAASAMADHLYQHARMTLPS